MSASLVRLREIVARLRAPDGCPWDRRQTIATLRGYLLEETYEVLDAIDREDVAEHAEELGDLLFQVFFQAQLREEAGEFDLDAVADGISDKLVRRHPHVFGDAELTEDEVAANWEASKRAEGKGGVADVPRALPALMRAQKVGRRAARVGFDWPDAIGPMQKLREETAELQAALSSEDDEAIAEELGDVLFTAVNIARHTGVDAEDALAKATAKFVRRFTAVERELASLGRTLDDASLDEMELLWDAVKASDADGSDPT